MAVVPLVLSAQLWHDAKSRPDRNPGNPESGWMEPCRKARHSPANKKHGSDRFLSHSVIAGPSPWPLSSRHNSTTFFSLEIFGRFCRARFIDPGNYLERLWKKSLPSTTFVPWSTCADAAFHFLGTSKNAEQHIV